MQKEEFITRLLNFGDDWKITDIRVNTDSKFMILFCRLKKTANLSMPQILL